MLHGSVLFDIPHTEPLFCLSVLCGLMADLQ